MARLTTGALHHVELGPRPRRAIGSWVAADRVGYQPFQEWRPGAAGARTTYLVASNRRLTGSPTIDASPPQPLGVARPAP